MSEPLIKVSLHCGAFMMVRDAGGLRPGEKLCVMDTDPSSTALRPKFEDGRAAPCFLGCPVAKRKCGYKLDKCFPSDDSLIGKQWRYVIECKIASITGTAKEKKEAQP